MKEAFGVFWRKFWDNLGHVVIFNFIWFTACIPLFLALMLAANTFVTREPVALGTGEPTTESQAAVETPVDADNALSSDSLLVGSDGKPVKLSFHFGPRGAAVAVFAVMAWLVLCAATGLVFYGMADLTTEYDFSGYKFIFRTYVRAGPMARSVALLNIFVFTFAASLANIVFYLYLAGTMSPLFLVLAGVMLWFVLFASMTSMLALAIMAQRDLRDAYERANRGEDTEGEVLNEGRRGLWQAIRSGAIVTLLAPGRTIVLAGVALLIFAVGMASGAGAGFFAMSGPAVLFNADVATRFRLDKEDTEKASE